MNAEERAAALHKRLELCLCDHPAEHGNTYRGIIIETLRQARTDALEEAEEALEARRQRYAADKKHAADWGLEGRERYVSNREDAVKEDIKTVVALKDTDK